MRDTTYIPRGVVLKQGFTVLPKIGKRFGSRVEGLSGGDFCQKSLSGG